MMPSLDFSLDTETTGLDLRHGCKPFFITFCDGSGRNTWFEWDVNPLTREPIVPPDDLEEIQRLITDADRLVLQNSKFDYTALQQVFDGRLAWDWSKVDDTLISAHLIASNQPKDLTTQALVYLSVNIKPYEDALAKAVKEARRLVETEDFIESHGEWAIAKEGDYRLPSAREETWRFDYWLPRAVAIALEYPADHPWRIVLSTYSNADSAVTLPLSNWHLFDISDRGLKAIYRERLRLLPIACSMEQYGVTGSVKRTRELSTRYKQESLKATRECQDIAELHGYKLVLPKSGNNNSLKGFIFDVLNLPKMSYTKKGNPSLDKAAIDGYLAVLDEASHGYRFLKTLKGKRSRDTAIQYLDGYERYWFRADGWFRLCPNLNITGTDTLRWSSSNPNEQNISKKEDFNLRYCFGPKPGREWWSCDAKNLELRIPAYEAGEQEMIDLFERPDDPPYYGSYHLLIFDTLHPEKFAEHGKASKDVYESTWYQWTKNGNFAVQYGAQEISGTADRAYHVSGAQRIIKSRFGQIAVLNEKWIDFANRHGYVETIPDKTICPDRGYPLLCTRNSKGFIKATVPLSYHVQGTAMWWTNKALVRVTDFLDKINSGDVFLGRIWEGGYYITLQVHDELVFDFPSGSGKGKEPWEYNLPIIRECQRLMMLGGDDIGVPTPVSCEYHETSWDKGLAV